MNPWIAADLARLREAELRRTAELRRQATVPARERSRHVFSRRFGGLLIRAGRLLGGELDAGLESAAGRTPLALRTRAS
jgi:hypothetical protein